MTAAIEARLPPSVSSGRSGRLPRAHADEVRRRASRCAGVAREDGAARAHVVDERCRRCRRRACPPRPSPRARGSRDRPPTRTREDARPRPCGRREAARSHRRRSARRRLAPAASARASPVAERDERPQKAGPVRRGRTRPYASAPSARMLLDLRGSRYSRSGMLPRTRAAVRCGACLQSRSTWKLGASLRARLPRCAKSERHEPLQEPPDVQRLERDRGRSRARRAARPDERAVPGPAVPIARARTCPASAGGRGSEVASGDPRAARGTRSRRPRIRTRRGTTCLRR